MDNTQPTCSSDEEMNKTATTGEASPVAEDNEQEMTTMADCAAYEESFKTLSSGDYLTGHVVRVNDEGVWVDVGYKTEGFIAPNQVTHLQNVSPASVVKVGDEIDVVVLRVDESEGTLTLSKKRADAEAAWRRVLKAQETGESFTATCVEQVRGGLMVDVGLRGFVPASHVDVRPVRDLSEYVGEVLDLKVLELDRSQRRVVLSRKLAIEERRKKEKEALMANLQVGSIVPGTVARLTNFGAFVNLGGVDGLIHISELAWRRIREPKDVVEVGQQVDVLILKIDEEKDRISLSLRQARPDPWITVCEQHNVGDIVKGRVTKIAPRYAFVEISEGVEALIPIGELANHRVVRVGDVVKVDQEVEARIIEMNRDSRRMVLSIKQVAPQPARENNNGGAGRMRHSEGGSGNSIGEILAAKGMKFDDAKTETEEA